MKELYPLLLDDFPVKSFDKLRYCDTDAQGHINNVAFSVFLETGRAELLLDAAGILLSEERHILLVRQNLSFVAEIHWPGQVSIGSAVCRLGNSSIELAQCVYQDSRLVAAATTVCVLANPLLKKSVPLSDEHRQALEALQLAKKRP